MTGINDDKYGRCRFCQKTRNDKQHTCCHKKNAASGVHARVLPVQAKNSLT